MISRNELYLMKIAGDEVVLPAAPESRIETYLAQLAGEEVTLPDFIGSRIETYLAKLCGVEIDLPEEPLSETELFLASLTGAEVELQEATTRINTLLATIIDNGGIGGSDEPEPEPEPEPTPVPVFRQMMNMTLTSYVDTNGETSLGDYCFSYDPALEEAVFPEVTAVPTGCFEYATALRRAVFPKATRSASSRGFMGCSNLEELRLPLCTSSMTNVLTSSSLSKLRILETKTGSWNLSMSSAKYLELLILRTTSVVSGTPSFNSASPIAQGTGRILVPADLVDSYKAASGWSTYANVIYAIGEDD